MLDVDPAVEDVPPAFRRPENRQLRFPFSVVVRRGRKIAGDVPGIRMGDPAGAFNDPPLAGGRTPDSDIRLRIAIVIGRHRNISGLAPFDVGSRRLPGCSNIPATTQRTVKYEVAALVLVKIADQRFIRQPRGIYAFRTWVSGKNQPGSI